MRSLATNDNDNIPFRFHINKELTKVDGLDINQDRIEVYDQLDEDDINLEIFQQFIPFIFKKYKDIKNIIRNDDYTMHFYSLKDNVHFENDDALKNAIDDVFRDSVFDDDDAPMKYVDLRVIFLKFPPIPPPPLSFQITANTQVSNNDDITPGGDMNYAHVSVVDDIDAFEMEGDDIAHSRTLTIYPTEGMDDTGHMTPRYAHVNSRSDTFAIKNNDTDIDKDSNHDREIKKLKYKWIGVILLALIVVCCIVSIVIVVTINEDTSKQSPNNIGSGLNVTYNPTSDPTILIFSNEPTNTPTIKPTNIPSLEPTTTTPTTTDPTTTDPTTLPTVDPTSLPTMDGCGAGDTSDCDVSVCCQSCLTQNDCTTTNCCLWMNEGICMYETYFCEPTNSPSLDPTNEPTHNPTQYPTNEPTFNSIFDPTLEPTIDPTLDPTFDPTIHPTIDPSIDPTIDPTFDPTFSPTIDPIIDPTFDPTVDPTSEPTADPTFEPTSKPTSKPTFEPTFEPTIEPTLDPTFEPTTDPTVDPTMSPTVFLPIPGELYPIPGTNDSYTIQNSTVYMDPIDISDCVMNTNGNHKLLNSSYIIMQYSVELENATFIIATRNNWDLLPMNCTQFPTLKIVEREYLKQNNVLYSKLFVIEAYFWEYFETLDVNMSNISMTNQTQYTPSDNAMAEQFAEGTNWTDVTYNTEFDDNMSLYYDGDRRRRLFKHTTSASLSIEPELQRNMNVSAAGGGLTLTAGADFECDFSFTFVCSFSILKGFTKLKFVLGLSSSLSVYVQVIINNVYLEKTVMSVGNTFTFWIGITPVTFEVYGHMLAAIDVRTNWGMQYEFGYKRVSYKWGIEYTKEHGWKHIAEATNQWKNKFFQKLTYSLDEPNACKFTRVTRIEFRLGVLFEDILNAYIATVLEAPITISYPSVNICNDSINECVNSSNTLGTTFNMSDKLYIGLGTGNGDWFVTYYNESEVGSWELGKWDRCWELDSEYLMDVCCNGADMRSTEGQLSVTDPPSSDDGSAAMTWWEILSSVVGSLVGLCILVICCVCATRRNS